MTACDFFRQDVTLQMVCIISLSSMTCIAVGFQPEPEVKNAQQHQQQQQAPPVKRGQKVYFFDLKVLQFYIA